MAAQTWYVDQQSGNNNYSGDSLAITQQGTDASIATSTLTVVSGGLTGKQGRIVSVNTTGTTYKMYLISAILTDTTATLTPLDALANCSTKQYYIGGAWKGLANATALRVFPGDAVRCKKSPDPTSLGQSAQWTQAPSAGNNTVVLTTAVTKEIDSCDVAWTQGTNVTQAQSPATKKEGADAQQFTTSSSFTTGSIATKSITFDGTGYQQVCFWFRANTNTLTAGDIELRLKHGATVRHTCTIPANGTAALWYPVVIDLGTDIASDIDTLELYANTSKTSQVFLIDNIFAAKASSAADSLTLNSLISKSSLAQGTTSSEQWYAIDSITGTSIVLRLSQNSLPAAPFPGYAGASESVALYKREPFILSSVAAGEVAPTISGSVSGNYVTYSGGWDTSSMTSKTGETWLSLPGINSVNVLTIAGQYCAADRFGAVGGNVGIILNASYMRATNLSSAATKANGITVNIGLLYNIDNLSAVGGLSSGIGLDSGGGHRSVGTLRAVGFSSTAVSLTGTNFTVKYVEGHTSSTGVALGANVKVLGGVTSLNTTAVSPPASGSAYLRNFTVNEVAAGANPCGSALANAVKLGIENYGGVAGATYLFSAEMKASVDSTVHHGAATQSWKMQPVSTAVAEDPGVLPLSKIAVNPSTLYTITGWCARNSASLHVSLVLPGGQLLGMSSSDAVSSMAQALVSVAVTNGTPVLLDVAGTDTLGATGTPVLLQGCVGCTTANGSNFVKNLGSDGSGGTNYALYSDQACTIPVVGNGAVIGNTTVACPWEQLSVTVEATEGGVVECEIQTYPQQVNSYVAWVSDLGVSS